MDMSVSIKKKEDLVKCLGKKIAESVIREGRSHTMKRVPFSVRFMNVKPQFYIDDGGGLFALAFGKDGEFLAKKYCGSGDTTINHTFEQLAEGMGAPKDSIIIFVERYASSSNCPWTLTVVSDLVTTQIAGN
jgi:hypothetical protein